ncbi:MAG: glycosyltransferase [Patescibacteria group bacterium]|nr:glycosyltransferase [Patescibacteria group bacterium]
MISVIIPVYKNKELFLKNLKKNFKFLKDYQIIIVNDDPNLSLKKDLESFGKTKNLILIENKENYGFAKTINIGVKKASYDYLLLLNSDVELIDDNFKKSINYFKKDKNLFAVSFAQIEKNEQIVGKNEIYYSKGLIHHQKSNNLNFGENTWAEGGASIFDKSKFLQLKGFDEIYSPFYWEDIDLSFRAKKLGYKILFDPKIKVIHHHQSTIGKYFSKKDVEIIAFRNQLIFFWKNIKDKKMVFNHLLNLSLIIISKKEYLLGFFQALKIYLIKEIRVRLYKA